VFSSVGAMQFLLMAITETKLYQWVHIITSLLQIAVEKALQEV